jgi:hypothetical protein
MFWLIISTFVWLAVSAVIMGVQHANQGYIYSPEIAILWPLFLVAAPVYIVLAIVALPFVLIGCCTSKILRSISS